MKTKRNNKGGKNKARHNGRKNEMKDRGCKNEDQGTLGHRGRGANTLGARLKEGMRAVGKRARGSHKGG